MLFRSSFCSGAVWTAGLVCVDHGRLIAAIPCENCRHSEQLIAALEPQVTKLTAAFEESQREGKRQAAPFRRQPPVAKPKRPGRKPGDDYGKNARRAVPIDAELDRSFDVPLPQCFPRCHSRECSRVPRRSAVSNRIAADADSASLRSACGLLW